MKSLRLLLSALTLLAGKQLYCQQLYDKYMLGIEDDTWKGVLVQVNQDSFPVMPFSEAPLCLKTFGPLGYLLCDRYGNPRFFTNGNTIASWDNTIMANGRGLNEGAYSGTPPGETDFEWPYNLPTYPIPDPFDEQVFYILHQYLQPAIEYPTSGLQITKIDMNARNGRGEVVYKNRFLHREWMGRLLCITRHGNGRDWWVVQASTDHMHYLALLLHRDSVVAQVWSHIEELAPPLDTFYTSNTPFAISADGSLIADRYGQCTAKLLHFDRCTGQVTLRDTFPIPCSRDCPPPLDYQNLAWFEFSPSGRYLYGIDAHNLIRWDLQAPDIARSREDLVPTVCGLSYNLVWPARILPNGMLALFHETYHSLIYEPDGPVSPENFCVSTYFRPSCMDLDFYLNSPPFPNYRLGPLAGSPCDTLEWPTEPPQGPAQEWTFELGPNPASVSFTVRILPGEGLVQPTHLRVFDVPGRRLYDLPLDEQNLLVAHPVEVGHWPSGVYFVSLFSGRRVLATRKLVVIH